MDPLPNKQFRWPSFSQWRQLHRVLGRGEKIILPILALIFGVSLFSLAQGLYIENTSIVPSYGGSITEGMVGSPRFLNPVYADTNDVDRDLNQLIYSGMLRYNGQGELVPDLASGEPVVEEGGKTITVPLKENVKWHDGAPFKADDVLFTISTIQDPAYKSPIRANWIGVDVEKVSDYKVRFHLFDPYAPFMERLTLKILPSHIWGQVSAENFALTPLNLQPVGTGPWSITKISQDRSGLVTELQLKAFEEYHSARPFIESLTFRFFNTEEELIRETRRGTIQSFSLAQIGNISRMKNPSFSLYSFSLPRYFALFFNLDPETNQKELSGFARSREARKALSLSLDKEQLVANVFQDNAHIIHSPFLPNIFGFKEPEVEITPNQEKALSLFAEAGYAKQDGKIGKPERAEEALAKDLQRGDTGEEVRRLQQCLASRPAGGPEVYPEGTVNGNFGQLTQQAVIRFQEKYASEVLTPIGLTNGTGKAGQLTREKLNALCFAGSGEYTPLQITILTVEQSPLPEVAKELERQWELFGVQTTVQTLSPTALERDGIKPRAYQALLFGEVLGKIPDPFPFWHSTQVKTPGLNLSSYTNKALDKLLEDARKEFDPVKRLELFSHMQELLLADVPAIFLYNFDYKYYVSTAVKGIQTPIIADPSWRFAATTEWYIKTKRSPK